MVLGALVTWSTVQIEDRDEIKVLAPLNRLVEKVRRANERRFGLENPIAERDAHRVHAVPLEPHEVIARDVRLAVPAQAGLGLRAPVVAKRVFVRALCATE